MEKRYNLSKAAKELGLTRQGLYYWIKKGWVTPKRDFKNHPVFTESDLKKIKIMFFLLILETFIRVDKQSICDITIVKIRLIIARGHNGDT